MEDEKVAIIIPVYNVEKYIARCMESILGQTYTNLEIILVDDGSTDASGDICEQYANQDERIQVIHQKNSGQGRGRNVGIERSTAPYIMFADSDDWIEKDTVEELLRLRKEENADIVAGGYYGYGVKKVVRWSHVPDGVFSFSGKEALTNGRLKGTADLVWGKLYKRDLFDTIRFPEGQLYEDSWLMPMILDAASIVTTYPRAIYHYYENEKSTMHTEEGEKQVIGRLKLYNHLSDFYYNRKLYAEAEQQAFSYILKYPKYQGKEAVFREYYKKMIRRICSWKLSMRGKLRLMRILIKKG